MIDVVYWGCQNTMNSVGSNRLLYREGHARRGRIHLFRDMFRCHLDGERVEYTRLESCWDAKEMMEGCL